MYAYEICSAYKSSQQQKNVFDTDTFNNFFLKKIAQCIDCNEDDCFIQRKKYMKTIHY